MATELKVPALGESISEAVVLEWLVAEGDRVEVDQDVVVLETDKITINVPATVGGVLVEKRAKVQDEVSIGMVIAIIDEAAEGGGGEKKAEAASGDDAAPKQAAAEKSEAPAASAPKEAAKAPAEAASAHGDGDAPLMPAVRRLIAENGLDAKKIKGTGPGGRILKEDVLRALEGEKPDTRPAATSEKPAPPMTAASLGPKPAAAADEGEEIVKMSKLRRTIAERLVEAQRTAAILTTFNEVDMTAVKALRAEYQDAFSKKYGVRLGFLSFFAKAVIEALKAYPAVNAEIRGDSVVYKNHYHIGVAVGGGRGLVVPVVRHADRMSLADFEKTLNGLADKAKSNSLSLEDLTGGTFTISNGGVYGSMLSTPILNAPQSGILGLHKIQDRPVAIDGKVEIRPMMYLALSYDHRIIDGREAVSFLVRVKECIEDPSRILLEI
ncbi:MAG: 2-oxoglutarate dehydrogenase complex dihydrolipoyllysine-residue succinyltransferase [Deltaproteobacteria bacterium]|nr:2-oxoglutarate dehydrogenase complex dihydrolipoyllysine-residue succinyltransferase [Deltaproteobacteria bacterium]